MVDKLGFLLKFDHENVLIHIKLENEVHAHQIYDQWESIVNGQG